MPHVRRNNENNFGEKIARQNKAFVLTLNSTPKPCIVTITNVEN